MTPEDRYAAEDLLVHALRQYVGAIAQHCHHDSPGEYEDYVNDLTEVDAGNATTFHDVRFAYLLHSYADYVPSPESEFLGSGPGGCVTWMSPHGWVVIDIVTTLALSELAPFDDQALVMRAITYGKKVSDTHLTGVRLIVLDAPHESSFYHPNGASEPLLTATLHPVAVNTVGSVR